MDDDTPRRTVVHEIGAKLDDLSVHELDERMEALRAEIGRLDDAKRRKQTALADAGSVFRVPPSDDRG